MIMDRKEQIEASNPYGNSSDFSAGKKIGFIIGAEWADAHPKDVINDCTFCRQEEFVTHKSKECDLSYEGNTLYVGVDIPQVGCRTSGLYGFGINYCPMCGRKLK